MYTKDSEMIRQAFKQVRLGLPVDGSRDYEIKIKDFLDVQVRNQKDQESIEGIDTEELQSNLTPEEVEKLASEIPVDDEDRADDMQIDMEDTIIVEE